MPPNRITTGGAVRRALLALAVALLAAALTACGGEGDGEPTTAVPDRELDAEILNGVLSRQLGVVEAYERTLPQLRGRALTLARKVRAQEQEHVDAVLKALRGIGADADAEPEEIESAGARTQADRLRYLYELEAATIDAELRAISELTGSWQRALLATIVANQAQHLVLLREALGAASLEAVPSAFEDGTQEAP